MNQLRRCRSRPQPTTVHNQLCTAPGFIQLLWPTPGGGGGAAEPATTTADIPKDTSHRSARSAVVLCTPCRLCYTLARRGPVVLMEVRVVRLINTTAGSAQYLTDIKSVAAYHLGVSSDG
jgi:hypothetical protein